MSTKGIESVLSRAMSDSAFADLLFAHPEQALSGFDLTAEEITKIKKISQAEFDRYTRASPEERKSMQKIFHPTNF